MAETESVKSRLAAELESAVAESREAEGCVARYRQALDQSAVRLLKSSGKVEGLRAALALAEEFEAGASAAEASDPAGGSAGESGDEG